MTGSTSKAALGVAVICLASVATVAGAQQAPPPPRIVGVQPAPAPIRLSGIMREEPSGNPVLETSGRVYAVVPHQRGLALRFRDAHVRVVATEVTGAGERSEILIHGIDQP